MKWLAALVVLLLVAVPSFLNIARRETPPAVTIEKPDRVVGQAGTLEVTVEGPGAKLKDFSMAVEQNGQVIPITVPTGSAANQAVQADPKVIRTPLPFGKQ